MERYFLGNNTAYGFYSNYEQTLRDCKRVFLLKGGPGTGKSSMLKKIANVAKQRGYDFELWFCSGDPQSLDGVYIKPLQTAVIDATAPHAMGADLPVIKDVIYDLATSLSRDVLCKYENEIKQCVYDKKHSFVRAYQHLKCALCHQQAQLELENEGVDTLGVRALALRFADDLRAKNREKVKPRCVFCKAICPAGESEYFDHLRDKKIYKVSGCDLSKCVFFDELTRLCDVDTKILDPLNPHIVDGVVCKDVAFVGECFDDKFEDVNLGVFEKLVHTDDIAQEKNAVVLQVGFAIDCLNRARQSHIDMERYFVSAMDFANNDKIFVDIVAQIFG